MKSIILLVVLVFCAGGSQAKMADSVCTVLKTAQSESFGDYRKGHNGIYEHVLNGLLNQDNNKVLKSVIHAYIKASTTPARGMMLQLVADKSTAKLSGVLSLFRTACTRRDCKETISEWSEGGHMDSICPSSNGPCFQAMSHHLAGLAMSDMDKLVNSNKGCKMTKEEKKAYESMQKQKESICKQIDKDGLSAYQQCAKKMAFGKRCTKKSSILKIFMWQRSIEYSRFINLSTPALRTFNNLQVLLSFLGTQANIGSTGQGYADQMTSWKSICDAKNQKITCLDRIRKLMSDNMSSGLESFVNNDCQGNLSKKK